MSNSNHLPLFSAFGKGKAATKAATSNCVIYTRVSTKEQADNNMSLETQKKACVQFAQKQGFQIMGHFGGTYESAKTDERKQFNSMLTFVRKAKEKVAAIIVYSVDRFSRSGGNAIYITEQLKKQGIIVYAVTQPTDATTASGSLQQNIQFIFSEYDNQLRREKCMAGMKEKLLSGGWMGRPPFGYDIVLREGNKEMVLNNKGRLIRKAFNWRAQGMSNEDVVAKLAANGWKTCNQRVSAFLRNPFYCGLVSHSALEGKVVEGRQEKAVSQELFLAVNGLLEKNHHGYRQKPENEEIPLKRFLKCAVCGQYLRAYKAKKNQEYYYKCNTKGCTCNKRADQLHQVFEEMLGYFCVATDEDLRELLFTQMAATYNRLNADKAAEQEELTKQRGSIIQRMERLEERYVLEEIDRQIFTKYKEKFATELQETDGKLAKCGSKVSNLQSVLQKALEMAPKLASLWASGDYGTRQRLQFLVFPDGICYDRKKDECRTQRVNSIFSCIAVGARLSADRKSGEFNNDIEFPALVDPLGVEPS